MSIIAPNGPFKLELQVAIISDSDPSNIGWVKFDLPPGVVPTAATIEKALQEVAEMPQIIQAGDYRLMGRHEFVDELLSERSGGMSGFAIPGRDEFDINFVPA